MSKSKAYFKQIDQQRQDVISSLRQCAREFGDPKHAKITEIIESSKHLAIKESVIKKTINDAIMERKREIANAKSTALNRVVSMVISGSPVEYTDYSNFITENEFQDAVHKGNKIALDNQNKKISRLLLEITTTAQSIHPKHMENVVDRALKAGVPRHLVDEACQRGKELRDACLLKTVCTEAFTAGVLAVTSPCETMSLARDTLLAKVNVDDQCIVERAYQDGRASVEQKKQEFERSISLIYPEEWLSSYTLIGVSKSIAAINDKYYHAGKSLGYSDAEICKLLTVAEEYYDDDTYLDKCGEPLSVAAIAYAWAQNNKTREEFIFRLGHFYLHYEVDPAHLFDDLQLNDQLNEFIKQCVDIFDGLFDAGRQCYCYRKKHGTKKPINRDFNKEVWRSAKLFGIPDKLCGRIGVYGFEETEAAHDEIKERDANEC